MPDTHNGNRDPDRNQRARRRIVERSSDAVKQAYRTGLLPLSTCADIAKMPPELHEQEIENRRNNPYVRAYPNRKRPGDGAPQPIKRPAQPRISPPLYTGYDAKFPPLTDAEKEHPGPDASRTEHLAWRARHGHFLDRPPKIERFLQYQEMAEEYARGVAAVARRKRKCSPAGFYAALDELLAHVPTPQRGRGTEIDFASDARAALKQLQDNIDAAIEQLWEDRTILTQRREAKKCPT